MYHLFSVQDCGCAGVRCPACNVNCEIPHIVNVIDLVWTGTTAVPHTILALFIQRISLAFNFSVPYGILHFCVHALSSARKCTKLCMWQHFRGIPHGTENRTQVKSIVLLVKTTVSSNQTKMGCTCHRVHGFLAQGQHRILNWGLS